MIGVKLFCVRDKLSVVQAHILCGRVCVCVTVWPCVFLCGWPCHGADRLCMLLQLILKCVGVQVLAIEKGKSVFVVYSSVCVFWRLQCHLADRLCMCLILMCVCVCVQALAMPSSVCVSF